MIGQEDILTIQLSAHEMELIYFHARKAEQGGVSRIRKGEERQQSLSEDQIIGQIGPYVGHKLHFGSLDGYKVSRWYANQNPKASDGGYDTPGGAIDWKASLMRRSPDPLTYNCVVRPQELHEEWVYEQMLVKEYSEEGAVVYVCGWITADKLQKIGKKDSRFGDALCVPVTDLNPSMPLKWHYFK